MTIITCNEPISKAYPDEVMVAFFTLLKRWGVPYTDWQLWAYSQKNLLNQLTTEYRKEHSNDAR